MGPSSQAVQWEVALMLGDSTGARALADSADIEPGARAFIDAWDGDAEAALRLDQLCRDDPLNTRLLGWCAHIRARSGDPNGANDLRYLANGGMASAAELRVATEPIVGRSLDDSQATFWGAYSYRRWQPWDMLVPSLLHLEYR
jgi:hypothetical protein